MTHIERFITPTAKPGVLFLLIVGLSFDFAGLLAAESLPRAAVFTDKLPGYDETFAREIAGQVSAGGYTIEFVGIGVLTNTTALSTAKFDLLVLPEARTLPALAAPVIESFLKQGGDLLALGLPAWKSPLFELNGRWLSRETFQQAIAAQRPAQMIFDFAKSDLRQWSRATDESRNPARHEITDSGHGRALHVRIEQFTGWETYQSPVLSNPFPSGHTLTCFSSKGTPHTKQLALEWTERDGSRWIATVDLTPEWKNYALPPEAFKAWQQQPARAGKGDHLRAENVVKFVVGIAHSHTALEGNAHEFWIADIGTAPSPFGDAKLPDEFDPPHLECFSQSYQFFPINAGRTSRLSLESRFLDAGLETGSRRSLLKVETAATAVLQGMHPRPRAVGFNQDRAYRWEPLLAARDAANDDYRGAIAALLVHVKPPYRGGVWAVFTPADAEFYRETAVTNCLQQTLARMKRGVFLTEGGAEFFTVFPEQRFRVGACAVNFGREAATNLSVSVELGNQSGKHVRTLKQATLVVAPGENESVEERAQLQRDDERLVRVTLRAGSEVIDSVNHEIGVWKPKPKPEFIEARDGGLWLRGKPWKANGVNYMPSSGIGLANHQHFEHWVGRGAYDPEVIERDLRRIKAMNLNSVSVFIYHESLGAQHMLDFLRRCDALDLKVNLSLRPGTPLDFRWNEMHELIEYYRLAHNDTVFAYDLAWEPRHGSHDEQEQTYRVAWANWVGKNIGKSWDVEKAWGANAADGFKFAFPDLKRFPIPPMEWLIKDGPWRRCVADYRRFLDEYLRERYDEARRLVKSADPHHAVSFRMQHAGDATFNLDSFLPYDFYGLADAVDIWEPEAYGRIGDWEKVKPGRFTADYARLCDPAKPVLWAEMGYTVWDNHRMASAAEKLDFQARYFADFYRMLNDSGADGIFFWWYSGGYRLNERSDFGLINPDGTDRPVTKIIREQGANFLKARKPNTKPDYWIAVDRDRDARGLFGIYEAAKDEYWKAIADGKRPGLKWAKRPGQAAGSP